MKAKPLSPELRVKRTAPKTIMLNVEDLLLLEGLASRHNKTRGTKAHKRLPGLEASEDWRRLTWSDVLRIALTHYLGLPSIRPAPKKRGAK